MNQAHLHLLLNHLPILGTLFGLLILTAGYIFKNISVKKTALGLFVLSAVMAVPAYLTGEGAEEIVENLPGVSENLMEEHEELANIFLWVVGVLGLLALGTFYADSNGKKITPILYAITLVVAIGAMIFAQQVGTSGGEIRHSEIRVGATATGLESPLEAEQDEKDDD